MFFLHYEMCSPKKICIRDWRQRRKKINKKMVGGCSVEIFFCRKYNFSEITFDSSLVNVFKQTYWTKPNLTLVREVAQYRYLNHVNSGLISRHSQDQWGYWLSWREDFQWSRWNFNQELFALIFRKSTSQQIDFLTNRLFYKPLFRQIDFLSNNYFLTNQPKSKNEPLKSRPWFGDIFSFVSFQENLGISKN